MKKILLIIILIILISQCSYKSILIKKIGGNFKMKEKMKLSIEAQKLIDKAFLNLDKNKITDYHIHILGINKKKNGCFVNKNMTSLFLHPIKNFKYKIYLSASGIKNKQNIDQEYLNRLNYLIENFNIKGKYHILAIDKCYKKNGEIDLKKTEFYIPNKYVYNLSIKNKHFVPVVSINPYKKNALNEVKKYGKLNVKYIKWLPNIMGINPSDKKLIPFYKMMKKYNMILLCHTGKEEAVDSYENQKFGNPLLLRLPLNLGVKVIAAHCACSGKNIDLDDKEKKLKNNFDLFLRLMDEKKYKNLLYADISALTQYNRMDKNLETILDRTDLHSRLVNGSDYPLPGINFLIQTKKLYKQKFITKEERKALNEIYKFNPLLFDFVLKRTIKSPGKKNKFADSIFMENNFLTD